MLSYSMFTDKCIENLGGLPNRNYEYSCQHFSKYFFEDFYDRFLAPALENNDKMEELFDTYKTQGKTSMFVLTYADIFHMRATLANLLKTITIFNKTSKTSIKKSASIEPIFRGIRRDIFELKASIFICESVMHFMNNPKDVRPVIDILNNSKYPFSNRNCLLCESLINYLYAFPSYWFLAKDCNNEHEVFDKFKSEMKIRTLL